MLKLIAPKTCRLVLALLIALVCNAALASDLDRFARCLDGADAKYYGTWWCPYCKKQNELFGSAVKKLPYVECSRSRSRKVLRKCNHVNAFPSWEFADGRIYTGVQSFSRLAQLTGCKAPKAKRS